MRLVTGIVLLAIVICVVVQALDGNPRELEECRKRNKGKWCTCRKLAKYIQDHLVGKRMGVWVPRCGRFYKKLFAKKQCYMNDMECWCVNPKTGLMIAGTKIGDRDSDYLNCDAPEREL